MPVLDHSRGTPRIASESPFDAMFEAVHDVVHGFESDGSRFRVVTDVEAS